MTGVLRPHMGFDDNLSDSGSDMDLDLDELADNIEYVRPATVNI